MIAVVLNGLAALPALARSVRVLLSRLGNGIDRAVSALAARKIPEWQMAQVRKDIDDQLRRAAGMSMRT